MTNIDNAITDIARGIIADTDDFTTGPAMTEAQLRARIDRYCDDPSTTQEDKDLIFARLRFITD